jgi:tripartite-type tricarboxylate transporter receptor subunit TctC
MKGLSRFFQVWHRIMLIVLTLCLTFTSFVWAEYPEKPVNVYVGFKAGGATDAMARMLGKSIEKQLGQPVVIVNKAGGGGTLAATTLKGSKPDGYHLAMTPSQSYTFMPRFMALQKKAPYGFGDFDYLATVGQYQLAFVGPPNVKSWQDLISLGKQKGGLSMAGMTPIDRLVSRFIAKKEGVAIKFVPFKGGAETLTALMGGHTDFAFSGGIHVKYTAAGKMKTLLALGSKPLLADPDVPTMKQLYGIGVEGANMYALPKGTPDNVIKTLEAAVAQAVQEKAYKGLMGKMRFPINYRDHKAVSKYLAQQNDEMASLFEQLK